MADNETQVGDAMLAGLYTAVTHNGGEIGLTLLVGGSWLTGIAVGDRSWLTQMEATVRRSPRGAGLTGVFDHLGRTMHPTADEVEAGVAEAIEDDRPTNFIHLRDARLVDHSGGTPTTGALVRCRIAAVDAWVLGNIGDQYDPPPLPVA